MALVEYTFSVQTYTTNDYLTTNCIDFSLFNAGDGMVYLDNFPIAPGQSFSVNGNVGEILRKSMLLTFDAATVYNATFVKRYYVGQE